MKKLISIILIFMFLFEETGYCSTKASLRRPLITKYETGRVSSGVLYNTSISRDIAKILPQLAQGSVDQKIAYCIIVKPWLSQHPEFLEQMVEWCNDLTIYPDLRKAAVANLVSLVKMNKRAKEILITLLARERYVFIRRAIIQGLLPLADVDSDVKDELLARLNADAEHDAFIRLTIIRGLWPFSQNDKTLRNKLSKAAKGLLKYLDRQDNRLAVLEGLLLLAQDYKSVRRALLRHLDEELDQSICIRITDGLLSLAEDDKYVKDKLLERLDKDIEPDVTIRAKIIQGLSPLAQDDNDVKDKLSKAARDFLEILPIEPNTNIRLEIIQGLLSLAEDDKYVKDKLLERLDKDIEPNATILTKIIQGLSPLAREDKSVKKALLKHLDEEKNSSMRLEIIQGLLPLVEVDSDVKGKLLDRLDKDIELDANIHLTIIQGLWPFSQGDKIGRDRLSKTIKDLLWHPAIEIDESTRIEIIKYSSFLAREDKSVKKVLLKRLDRTNDPSIRTEIINNLLPLAEGDEYVKGKLLERIDTDIEPRYSVRAKIIQGLWPFSQGDKTLRDRLLKAARNVLEDLNLREDRLTALECLLSLAEDDKYVRNKLSERLDKDIEPDPSIRAKIMQGLWPFSQNDKTLRNKLSKAAKDALENLDRQDNRLTVLDGLLLLAQDDKSVRRALLRHLDEELDQSICIKILGGLLLLAPEDKDVKKTFMSILVKGSSKSEKKARLLAYSFWPSGAMEYGPYAYKWEENTVSSDPTGEYHRSLAELHAPYHNLFIVWLKTVPLKPLPGFRTVDLNKKMLLNNNPMVIDSGEGQWFGRSLLKDGKIYKVKRFEEKTPDLLIEAAMWNKLNPDNPAMVMTNCKVLNLGKGAPYFLRNNKSATVMVYSVKDIDLFTTYATNWNPRDYKELADWLCNGIDEAARISENGWGYAGFIEHYHDAVTHRVYNLEATPVGCMDNIDRSMKYSNIRAGGKMADENPQHMVNLGKNGADPAVLARVIRDQCFQVVLIAGRISAKKGFSHKEFEYIIERIGNRFIEKYAHCQISWKNRLPVTLAGISKETLFAMNNLQNGIDMGFDNDPFSAPSIVALSESIAMTIVGELVGRQMSGARGIKEWFFGRFHRKTETGL